MTTLIRNWFLASASLVCGLLTNLGSAADFSIIVDSSGSMSELTQDGQTKMEAAKQALRDLKADLSAHQIGMTVFGHRTDPKMIGSCQDVETVLPIADFIEQEYDRVVNNLRPRGNTPLAASLKLAASELMFRDKSSNKIVIVVTDGNETCGGDPVAVAKQMQAMGINVRVHVIGFGVKPQEQEQLRQLAAAGNGRFGLANTKADLEKLLRKQIQPEATAPQAANQPAPKLSVIEKALVSKLQDENRDVRTSAANTLLKMKAKAAVPHLCERLQIDEDHYAWDAAAKAALALDPEQYRATLISAMQSKLDVVRIRAAQQAASAGENSSQSQLSALDQALVTALEDEHRDVRTAAAESLSKRKTAAAVPHLVARIPVDADHYAWDAAFKALHGLSQEKAAEALLTALDAENATVRTRATERLSAFAAVN